TSTTGPTRLGTPTGSRRGAASTRNASWRCGPTWQGTPWDAAGSPELDCPPCPRYWRVLGYLGYWALPRKPLLPTNSGSCPQKLPPSAPWPTPPRLHPFHPPSPRGCEP